MPGPVPTNRKLRTLAEKTRRRRLLKGRFYDAASRKYASRNLPGRLQEDQAGALWEAYRTKGAKRRARRVRRAWQGKGY